MRAAKSLGAKHELAFDATDHEAVRKPVDAFETEIGAVDILVNNAGMQYRTPLEEFPADAFERGAGKIMW